MESETQSEWSSALDEDLLNCSVCPVLLPDSSPWIGPTALNQHTADEEHSTTIPETQSQSSQTDQWRDERSTNTNEDWESEMRTIEDYSIELTQQYGALVKQQAAEQDEHSRCISGLEKKKDDKNHQYQSVMEKIESLQTKLKLNSSKTTRKNFMVKRQELTSEKEQKEEENTRLAQELEESDRKLKLLIEEQNHEKLSWEKEIADLRVEMETLCRQAEQANKTALQDETAALEMQRELAISQVEDWIAEAERYLNSLRSNPSQQHLRQKWEQNVATVRSSLAIMKNKFNDNHQLLQRGEELNSLPSIPLPTLPPVPTLELLLSPLQNPASHPLFNSAPPTSTTPPSVFPQLHPSAAPSQRATPPQSAPSPQNTPYVPVSSTIGPQSAHANTHITMTTTYPSQGASYKPVTATQIIPPTHVGMPGASPATSLTSAATHAGLPSNHVVGFHPQATVRLSQPLIQSTSTRNSSPQPVSSSPSPAGKLDKLLERLSTHFPLCTREQLTRVLQQIKSERGTMAGMSIDDVTQQVAQRLAQNPRPPPGPIAPPSGSRPFPGPSGPIQRPTVQTRHPVHAHFRPPVAQVFHTRPPQPPVRKFCLICQNPVDTESQYITNCPHTLHKDCVSVWLKSSKNNPCPFCPSK